MSKYNEVKPSLRKKFRLRIKATHLCSIRALKTTKKKRKRVIWMKSKNQSPKI